MSRAAASWLIAAIAGWTVATGATFAGLGAPECAALLLVAILSSLGFILASPAPAASGLRMSTPTIVAMGEDLSTACALGLCAARDARAPADVRWGEVVFTVQPGDSLETAHQRFFSAASVLRQARDAERGVASRAP